MRLCKYCCSHCRGWKPIKKPAQKWERKSGISRNLLSTQRMGDVSMFVWRLCAWGRAEGQTVIQTLSMNEQAFQFSQKCMMGLPKMHWLKDPLLTKYILWSFIEFQNLVQDIWVSKHQYDRPHEASRSSFRETSVTCATHPPLWRMLLSEGLVNIFFIEKACKRVENRQPALQNEIEGGPKPPFYYSILFWIGDSWYQVSLEVLCALNNWRVIIADLQ